MKALIQRVTQAGVRIGNAVHSNIGKGYVVLLGIAVTDTQADAEWLCQKIIALRIFADEQGLMNKSITEAGGQILLVSQFTLIAAYRNGSRPSFLNAARPEQAIPLYQYCIEKLNTLMAQPIATGLFGADMEVQLTNDGPVTIMMDSKTKD